MKHLEEAEEKRMPQYELVRDYVYSAFSKIYNPAMQMAAYTHTNSVDAFITMFAIANKLDVEQAKIAALFHDYAKYVDNCPAKDHARLSSLHAHQFLCTLKDFPIEAMDEICFAILKHSDKGKVDSPLAEALKDADVYARFCENPYDPLDSNRRRRLLRAKLSLEA